MGRRSFRLGEVPLINTNNTQRIHDLRRLGMGPTADAFQRVVDQLADCRRLLSEQSDELARLGGRNFSLAIDAQRTVDQVREELAKVREELDQERRNRSEEVGYFTANGATASAELLTNEEVEALCRPIKGVIEPRPFLAPGPKEMLSMIQIAKKLAHSVTWVAALESRSRHGGSRSEEAKDIARRECRGAYLASKPLPAPDVEFIEADLCDRCGGGGVDPFPNYSFGCGVGAVRVVDRVCIECHGSGISQAADYDQAFTPVHDDEES